MILSNSVPHFFLNLQIGKLGPDGCSTLTVVVQGRVERRPKDSQTLPRALSSKQVCFPSHPSWDHVTLLSDPPTAPRQQRGRGALKCSTPGKTGASEDWTGACLASFASSSGWGHSSGPGWIPLTMLRATGEGSSWAPGATDLQTQA